MPLPLHAAACFFGHKSVDADYGALCFFDIAAMLMMLRAARRAATRVMAAARYCYAMPAATRYTKYYEDRMSSLPSSRHGDVTSLRRR